MGVCHLLYYFYLLCKTRNLLSLVQHTAKKTALTLHTAKAICLTDDILRLSIIRNRKVFERSLCSLQDAHWCQLEQLIAI